MFKLRAINLLQFRLQLFCQNSASKPLDSKRTPKAKLRILGTRGPSLRISIGQCAKTFLIKRSVNPLDLFYKLVNLNGDRILRNPLESISWNSWSSAVSIWQWCLVLRQGFWLLPFEICFEMIDYCLERRLCLPSLSFPSTIAYVTSVCYFWVIILF
jgi:hypothetical protein